MIVRNLSKIMFQVFLLKNENDTQIQKSENKKQSRCWLARWTEEFVVFAFRDYMAMPVNLD